MIHWMISGVTSALCFQRSLISFSKTEFQRRSVVTPASRPMGLPWTQLTANTAAFTAALLFAPWTQPSQRCCVRGHLVSQTKTNTFPRRRAAAIEQPLRRPPLRRAQRRGGSAAPRAAAARRSHTANGRRTKVVPRWTASALRCDALNRRLCSHRRRRGFSPQTLLTLTTASPHRGAHFSLAPHYHYFINSFFLPIKCCEINPSVKNVCTVISDGNLSTFKCK